MLRMKMTYKCKEINNNSINKIKKTFKSKNNFNNNNNKDFNNNFNSSKVFLNSSNRIL